MNRPACPALLLAGLLALAACSQDRSPYGPTGACCPTVADGPPPQAFGSYPAARGAFTRASEDGEITATLKDAAWLRFEGTPEEVARRHKDYFEFVYTSFEVVLRTKEFTNPSEERFVLEDSSGARIAGSPIKYEAEMIPVDDRHQFTFDLAFDHQVTRNLGWIRLTRSLTGQSVEWTFSETPAAASR